MTHAAGHSRAEVAGVLSALTRNATVQWASAAAVRQAASFYENGAADFADCLLTVQALAQDALPVMTFDRKMRKLPGVQVL